MLTLSLDFHHFRLNNTKRKIYLLTTRTKLCCCFTYKISKLFSKKKSDIYYKIFLEIKILCDNTVLSRDKIMYFIVYCL